MSGVISDNTVRSSGQVAPLSSSTLDASNPAVDTNPTDGVGTKWVNTTSGQIFICTDATTDANHWIGQTGTALVGPRCIWAGGNSDNADEHNAATAVKINEISYVVPTTLGDATDFGDLLETTQYFAGTSNGTNERGIFAGGYDSSSPSEVVQYITCSSAGNATDLGNLAEAMGGPGASSNATSDRATFSGGNRASIPPNYDRASDMIQYITISSAGNATDSGNLTSARDYTCGTDNGTDDRGINAAGRLDGGVSGNTNSINYWTISSTGNAAAFGTLTGARFKPWTASSDTNNRGLFGGGELAGTANPSNNIEYITISSTGNGTSFGDMTGATPSGYPDYSGGRGNMYGSSSGTGERGLYAGGYTSGPNWYKQIEYVTISSTGNSTSFGDLSKRAYGKSGCSNTFG